MRRPPGSPMQAAILNSNTDSEASYNTAFEDKDKAGAVEDSTALTSGAGQLTCPACGHRPLKPSDYAESAGIVPAGGALANAVTQGGMDALEELRLLKDQVRSISDVTTAVAQGDFSQKVTIQATGEINTLKDTVNRMVDQLSLFAAEVTRVAVEVGTQGKFGGQVEVEGLQGRWKDVTDNVNVRRVFLFVLWLYGVAARVVSCPPMRRERGPEKGTWKNVRSMSCVMNAVANGDLSKTMEVDSSGEMLDLKVCTRPILHSATRYRRYAKGRGNMVTRLGDLKATINDIVGTDGRLGGRRVEGVQGTWRELTDNLNEMASNLTNYVRSIAEVTKAVALGDLTKIIEVDVSGEMLDLKCTINEMVARLWIISREVNRVALEVAGGKFGGQAEVEGLEGTWKDLTDNVNKMANLVEGRGFEEVRLSVPNFK
ncbi:hypothetical protein MSAN_02104200 [Mycena sanguinolenta]|uniref:HAMP domain-containing protein n=1 Tax=Mycena sanguinolenta TaxID=230812 RepID=A0A8H6XGR8_9AGAR|nr:hypothetical protein MSAN_02104200 [Mycena sanguinolenta]